MVCVIPAMVWDADQFWTCLIGFAVARKLEISSCWMKPRLGCPTLAEGANEP